MPDVLVGDDVTDLHVEGERKEIPPVFAHDKVEMDALRRHRCLGQQLTAVAACIIAVIVEVGKCGKGSYVQCLATLDGEQAESIVVAITAIVTELAQADIRAVAGGQVVSIELLLTQDGNVRWQLVEGLLRQSFPARRIGITTGADSRHTHLDVNIAITKDGIGASLWRKERTTGDGATVCAAVLAEVID